MSVVFCRSSDVVYVVNDGINVERSCSCIPYACVEFDEDLSAIDTTACSLNAVKFTAIEYHEAIEQQNNED